MRFKTHTLVVIALVVTAIVLVLVSLPAGGAASGAEPAAGAGLDREGGCANSPGGRPGSSSGSGCGSSV